MTQTPKLQVPAKKKIKSTRGAAYFALMSSSQEKKRKTKESARGSERKRGAEEDLELVPTIGDVLAEFPSIGHLFLDEVKRRPVNELSEELRAAFKRRGGDEFELLLLSFFAACDARVEEAAPKRANVAFEEESFGEQFFFLRFSSFVSLLRFCVPTSALLVALSARKALYVRSLWMPHGGEAR